MSPPDTLRGSSTAASAGPSSPAGTTREPTWKQHAFDLHAPAGGPPQRAASWELDLDEYFEGPRDIRQFSRLPLCLRLYGSVLPKMLVPLLLVGAYAATIAALCEYVCDLGINSILLTILGFIVGLALSFRFSTAYERYSDGSKYWTALVLNARVLARVVWVFVRERHDAVDGDDGKADLLGKLSALNLLNAFASAMKHRLRFEPAVKYPDLAPLVRHLDTMAARADQEALMPKERNAWWK